VHSETELVAEATGPSSGKHSSYIDVVLVAVRSEDGVVALAVQWLVQSQANVAAIRAFGRAAHRRDRLLTILPHSAIRSSLATPRSAPSPVLARVALQIGLLVSASCVVSFQATRERMTPMDRLFMPHVALARIRPPEVPREVWEAKTGRGSIAVAGARKRGVIAISAPRPCRYV